MTVIVTKRLLIAPSSLNKEFLQKQVQWLSDPEIMRYSEQRHNKHTVESQIKYIESFSDPDKFMEIHCSGELIGTMNAYVDKWNSVANLGILIGDRTKWGQKFGAEAWKAFSDHLLSAGVRKIETGCMGCNYTMMNVCLDTGMKEEGRRKNHFMVEGILTDMVEFARFE